MMSEIKMTPLKQHLIKLIKLHGPIPISSYMTEALTNPKHGYYVTQNPFGVKGDFITAPDVSQMFGELIGLWFADVWLKMNKPQKIFLLELGPGNGSLMKDFMRVLKVLPEFVEAIEIHFVEASPQLIEIQKDKFKNFPCKKYWHETVKSALNATVGAPTYIIANEFFDALPIRQFQKGILGWHERMVGVDKENEDLKTMLAPFAVAEVTLPEGLRDAELHSVIEVSPMAEYLMVEICNHIKTNQGAALIIDYGYTKHRTGETLQGVEDHKYANIYQNPGQADLSAHVNFCKLCEIIEKIDLKPLGPIFQGKFLEYMGIEERVKSLTKSATPEQASDLLKSLSRLVAPDEMGTLFKVIAMVSTADNDADEIEIAGFNDGPL